MPGGDIGEALRERAGWHAVAGPVIDADGRDAGQHPGSAAFTVGQRAGLGVALGERQYVASVDVAANIIQLGRREDLERSVVRARPVGTVDGQRPTLPSGRWCASATVAYPCPGPAGRPTRRTASLAGRRSTGRPGRPHRGRPRSCTPPRNRPGCSAAGASVPVTGPATGDAPRAAVSRLLSVEVVRPPRHARDRAEHPRRPVRQLPLPGSSGAGLRAHLLVVIPAAIVGRVHRPGRGWPRRRPGADRRLQRALGDRPRLGGHRDRGQPRQHHARPSVPLRYGWAMQQDTFWLVVAISRRRHRGVRSPSSRGPWHASPPRRGAPPMRRNGLVQLMREELPRTLEVAPAAIGEPGAAGGGIGGAAADHGPPCRSRPRRRWSRCASCPARSMRSCVAPPTP